MKVFLTFTLIILLTGCDTFWQRSSSISANTKLFPECAFQAVSNIEGVTTSEYMHTKGRVVGHTPYSEFEVLINEFGNIEVRLHGRGSSPPSSSNNGVNNFLSIISTKVANACNHS